MDRTLDSVAFVRGMFWHDLGKPLALGTSKHAPLGYWLLVKTNHSQEAKVALAHGSGTWKSELKNVLKAYFDQGGERLPALLMFSNPVDRISASIYSMLSRQFDRDKHFKAGYPFFHSWQNPFSHLPLHSPELDRLFIVREDTPDRKGGASRESELDEPLREYWVSQVTDGGTQDSLQVEDVEAATRLRSAIKATPLGPSNTTWQTTLLNIMAHYPERTYPPANDTSLIEHCRLSGALAFVLYRNLEQSTEDQTWLCSQMWLDDQEKNNRYLLGNPEEPDQAIELHTCLQTDEDWTLVQRLACKHLCAHLVRITFAGHREWFERAVRVDDLLGARLLARRFMDAFEVELAQELGVGELATEDGPGIRRCELTLVRNQFELFYLLPPHPDPEGVHTIEEVIDRAYQGALSKVTRVLIADLKQDFRRAVAAGKLHFDSDAEQALGEQLRLLSYRLRIQEIPMDTQVASFGDFTGEYGQALVEKLRDSHEFVKVPQSECTMMTSLQPALAAEDTCAVCDTHPVYAPFVALLEDPDWESYVRKVVHYYRQQPEHLCLACIARRILAHGVVAGETQVLQSLVTWADVDQPIPRVLTFKIPTDKHLLPPSLVTRRTFESDDDFVDLGAAYARYRRRGNGVDYTAPPQVFPTTSFAADAMGNVILLTLQPTGTLWGEFNYVEALEHLPHLPAEMGLPTWHPTTDQERFAATYGLFYQSSKDCSDELAANMACVKPHLARIMERISHFKHFYRVLKETLEAEPIRVLPLDVEFPTLRLLLPADRLDDALSVFDRVVTETLFSATYVPLKQREAQQNFLSLIIPNLLHGAAVLFKHKFPLYLALEAERDLFSKLVAYDANPAKEQEVPGDANWYGFRLAFSDLRGTLSETGPQHATVTYANLGQVLNLVRTVDRATIEQYAATAAYHTPAFAEARALVRAGHIPRARKCDVEQMAQDKALFNAVYFITRAIRR